MVRSVFNNLQTSFQFILYHSSSISLYCGYFFRNSTSNSGEAMVMCFFVESFSTCGQPNTILLSATDLLTTALAPTLTPLPILISPNNLEPGPINIKSPSTGTHDFTPPHLIFVIISILTYIHALMHITPLPYSSFSIYN